MNTTYSEDIVKEFGDKMKQENLVKVALEATFEELLIEAWPTCSKKELQELKRDLRFTHLDSLDVYVLLTSYLKRRR